MLQLKLVPHKYKLLKIAVLEIHTYWIKNDTLVN